MRIAVCVKQVPNTEARLRVAPDGRWIDQEDLSLILNENDTYALEEGLRLAEAHKGEVVVITLGPDGAKEALRKGLAMGAARAVHLKDDGFLDGDASAVGRALAAAVRHVEADLVLTGSQSDDVGYAATGSIIAGELDWPHAWLVMGLEIASADAGQATVVREMESGMNERAQVPLPAVIQVQAGINQPRYASLRGIMQAKRKPIDVLSPADLGLDASQVGAAGSRIEIVDVAFPDSGAGAQLLEGDDAAQLASQLVDKLRNEARVL
ncbi:MAG: electron transfer flavoprotein subunit beta/FixA family protein [Acidobacteriota bacterium]